MADSYLGEIRLFVGKYAPMDWEMCNGQTILISQNEALYSLIGTTYGGNGKTTFALPDFRGRVPVHMGKSAEGSNYNLKDKGGAETVQLTESQLPAHTHLTQAQRAAGEESSPENNFWAASTAKQYSGGEAPNATLGNSSTLYSVGGNQPHNNMMPFMALTYIICTNGLYPIQQS
ncbi:tail fiber protein [Paenibacillus algorifonticola]|uniref:phage tail protein n=1 Tax=Paenibacillus algorifonticola TaxID=684063 RepID=UPI003D2728CE